VVGVHLVVEPLDRVGLEAAVVVQKQALVAMELLILEAAVVVDTIKWPQMVMVVLAAQVLSSLNIPIRTQSPTPVVALPTQLQRQADLKLQHLLPEPAMSLGVN
jgi:hypothetical protein